VHSFTSAGWFGYVFLGYLVVIAAAYFAALFVRLPQLKSTHRLESALSREGSFLLNNWGFMGVLAVVFWGTLFPVISEAVRGVKISVGPAFFNAMAAPLGLFLLLLTGVGPLIAWRKASWTSLRRQFVWPGAAGAVTAVVLLALFGGSSRGASARS
jgi:cytochrome c-type biogenesis protein CcmF